MSSTPAITVKNSNENDLTIESPTSSDRVA
jgi:hypothetical protein